MAQHPLLMRIVSNSICIANKCGQIIRNIMEKGEIGLVEKGVNNPQTEADRMSESIIISSLAKQFPGLTIIGEEGAESSMKISTEIIVTDLDEKFLEDNKCPDSYSDIAASDLMVWVDPLDGTTEYTQGFLEHVTVLIGISFKGTAIGGIVHQPYFKTDSGDLGRTIWSIKDSLGNQSIYGGNNFAVKKPPENKFICTTTRSHGNQFIQDSLNELQPDEIIRVGGAGFKVLQLLEGKAHAYVFPSKGCKKWDTCAVESLLESCGGTLTDILGRHYVYDKTSEYPNVRGVLATIGVPHDDIVGKIPEHVKDAFKK